jgi:hypothetical protein
VIATGGCVASRSFFSTPPTRHNGAAMTENAAKEHLLAVLDVFTAGTVLHLLAEIVREEGAESRRAGDSLTANRCEQAAVALFVMGLGIDAALPQ